MEIDPRKLRFFRTSAAFRRWLKSNHDRADELWVGFHRKDSGKGGITYSEALDEALCFGWIDGVRKKLDDVSFTNRFTPRKVASNWSAVNVARVAILAGKGRMTPSGVAAFQARDSKRPNAYSFEREKAEFPEVLATMFRANERAWRFFSQQPPYYRRLTTWWVISAKREETRLRRLDALMEDSARQRRIPQLSATQSGPASLESLSPKPAGKRNR